jgi:GxxExxY protein
MINEQYKYSELTSQIIAAAMEVHSFLGSGFLEIIYQRALSYELDLRKIDHEQEFVMPVNYKDIRFGTRRVDFLIEGKISVEIKARSVLEPEHLAQAINYLEAYNLEIGLLINFGETRLKFHRLKNKKYRD